jgi:3-oxoacyl-[acyl-carrier-protein] synthase-3
MKKTIIKGTGRYLPSRLVTNEDLSRWMDTSNEWIIQRTGIEQRYWVPEEGGVGSLRFGAGGFENRHVTRRMGAWRHRSDHFCNIEPGLLFPGSGCLLAHKLGLTATPALDIRQQCTGFLYGMATADAYIRSSLAKRILLVGAEVHSTGLDISTQGGM